MYPSSPQEKSPIMPESFHQPLSILVNMNNSHTQRTPAKPLLLLYNLALPIIFALRGTPRTWRARNYRIATPTVEPIVVITVQHRLQYSSL